MPPSYNPNLAIVRRICISTVSPCAFAIAPLTYRPQRRGDHRRDHSGIASPQASGGFESTPANMTDSGESGIVGCAHGIDPEPPSTLELQHEHMLDMQWSSLGRYSSPSALTRFSRPR